MLGFARGPSAIQTEHGDDEAERDGQCEAEEQRYPRHRHAGGRERESICDHHQRQRADERNSSGNGRAARMASMRSRRSRVRSQAFNSCIGFIRLSKMQAESLLYQTADHAVFLRAC